MPLSSAIRLSGPRPSAARIAAVLVLVWSLVPATLARAFQGAPGETVAVFAPGADSTMTGLIESVPEIQQPGGGLPRPSGRNVAVFRGIPYARPPIGDLRWRAPQPLPPGNPASIDATRFRSPCEQSPLPNQLKMQGRASSGFIKPYDFKGSYGIGLSEDCLYLNIWSPEPAPAPRLPVMVFIHGGGFVRGTSVSPRVYGSQFAIRGAVLVSFDYRLGGFGFFSHPAFNRDGPSDVNFGLLDQIAALRWIKANIAAFGGDPGNVTIFGSSAGGASVQILMTSPAIRGEGLFHRAVSQSGGGAGNAPPAFGQARNSAESLGQQFFASIDRERACANPTGDPRLDGASIATAAALFGVDVALRQCVETDQVMTFFGLRKGDNGKLAERRGFPYLDNKTVAQSNRLQAFAIGAEVDIPMMIGSTSHEQSVAGLRAGVSERVVANLARTSGRIDRGREFDGFVASYRTDPAKLRAGNMLRDIIYGFPAYELARLHAANKRSKAYVYYMNFVPPARVAKRRGMATHGLEMLYVFGWPEWAMSLTRSGGSRIADADVALSRALMRYWLNFAKHGDPNEAYDYPGSPDAGLSVPLWPAMNAASNYGVLDIANSADGTRAELTAGPHPLRERYDLMIKAWWN